MQITKVVTGKIGGHRFMWRKTPLVIMLMPILFAMGLTQADFVELALGSTETTETSLGTITIPNTGVRRIVGVYGVLVAQAITTAEGIAGYFRLQFKTVAGVFKFPATIFAGPAGTLASPMTENKVQIIPVNIPVPPNETVTCYMATFLATTSTCRGMVGLILE